MENGKSIQYFYDHTGARTKKVVDGTVTEYRMAGDLLVSEKDWDSDLLIPLRFRGEPGVFDYRRRELLLCKERLD